VGAGDIQAMEQAVNHGGDTRPYPDVILRTQFFELIGKRQLSSEQRLMLAVLADAINVVQDFCRSAGIRRRRPFVEAWNWIFRRSGGCPLSFEHVCDALGMNAEALRDRLAKLKSGAVEAPARLRLKDASRIPRMTVNRSRVRHRGPMTHAHHAH